MAAVTLRMVVVSLASDLAQSVACYSDAPPSYVDQIEGEVRSFGGRRRILLGDDEGVSFGQTLRELTAEHVRTLRSWKGLPVLYRDAWGTKVYGTYLAPNPQAEKARREVWSLAIAFTESTVYESV